MRKIITAFIPAVLSLSCAAPHAITRNPGLPQGSSPGAKQDEFLAAHGEFGRAARRPTAPMIELSALRVPEGTVDSEPGEFELSHYKLDATVPIPVSRDTYLIAGAHAGARDYQMSPQVQGADDEVLYNAGLRLGVGHFFDDDVSVQAYWQPSIYSDLDGSLDSRDWKLWYGAALAVWRANPELYWKAGLLLSDAQDTGVIPLLGVAWLFAAQWRLDVLLPRTVELSFAPHPSWTLTAGFDVESEEFHVRSSAATGKIERDIHVQDVRAFVGAFHRVTENALVFLKVGTNVAGNYDWSYLPTPDYTGTLEPAFYAQVGFGWNF